MSSLYLIVGLGNPGKKYEHTRHNVGFDCVDLFATSLGIDIDKDGFQAKYVKTKYFDKDIILFKPQTFMNNSGDAIREIVNYFKIDIDNILIIYDEMDFNPGQLKIKENGSSGGHNGIKSIIANLGTQEFKRIRLGIGKPEFNSIDFVLGKPSKEDQEKILQAQTKAVDAIKIYLKESFNKAMSIYNKKDELPES